MVQEDELHNLLTDQLIGKKFIKQPTFLNRYWQSKWLTNLISATKVIDFIGSLTNISFEKELRIGKLELKLTKVTRFRGTVLPYGQAFNLNSIAAASRSAFSLTGSTSHLFRISASVGGVTEGVSDTAGSQL